MSTLSKLASGQWIVPGDNIVSVISTSGPKSRAADVLREVASTFDGSRIARDFPEQWQQEGQGVQVKRGVIRFAGGQYPLTVKIGAQEGLVLREVDGKIFSLRPTQGQMCLEVGKGLGDAFLQRAANEVVACWVVHGMDWQTRPDQHGYRKRIHQPYGLDPKICLEAAGFKIIDGAKEPKTTLRRLIACGCIRNTHVGEWKNRHSTLIAAVCDMPLTLHEFKMCGGDDICEFLGLQIGKNSDLWGPFCGWNESLRGSRSLGIWAELSTQAVSPFAFHVHATRTIFPHARLDSDYLLEKIGQQRLLAILEMMAQQEPDRFYRLIDQNGKMHKITHSKKDSLEFGPGGSFRRSDIPGNVLGTFRELRAIQRDCTHRLSPIRRVVIDTHAYLVIEALAEQQKDVFALSGRDMHSYLTQGGWSGMHRIRNDRLFLLLREFFSIQEVNFHVWPPLAWNSGLWSQYDDLGKCPKDFWLDQEI